MKRSIILSKQNYFAAKGKCDEDRYIRNSELVSSRIIYRENKKWRNFLKSKPKNERDRLDKIVIKSRARRYEAYKKDKNHESLGLDLEAIEVRIMLTNELPNFIDGWSEKKEPKVWNNSGQAYNKKWRPNSMT